MEGGVLVVVGSVYGRDVLGKAVWAETEQRSVADHVLFNLATKSGSPTQALPLNTNSTFVVR